MTHAPFHEAPQSDYRLLRSEKKRGKLILTLRTDRPEAEVGIYQDAKQVASKKWQADRQLAETIHTEIKKILDPDKKLLDESSNFNGAGLLRKLKLSDLEGIVVYKGPGSFTGLRIGMSMANALAYSLKIPIVAKSGKNWLDSGIKSLLAGNDDRIALPEYDRPANTTKPRK